LFFDLPAELDPFEDSEYALRSGVDVSDDDGIDVRATLVSVAVVASDDVSALALLADDEVTS
jgi:hypothetical protein